MSVKTLIASAAVALTLPIAANAAGFSDCTSFTLSTSGDGSVSVLGAGFADCAFSLVGSDQGSGLTLYTAQADQSYEVDFDWAYSTQDVDGSSFDPAGYTIDGALTQLTVTLAPPAIQSGSASFTVAGGQTFGWYVNSTDGILGAADLDVFANFTAVPLPAGGLLLLTALGGLVAARRRKAA